MSIKANRNLIIVVSIAVALLAGTVLLASFSSNVKPAVITSSPKADAGTCPMAKTALNAETCPAGRTEPCCAEEGQASECEKACAEDCTKPCCAKEETGGCPMQAESSGCCPAETGAAVQ